MTTPPYGLQPFDLQVPWRLLYPGRPHDRKASTRTVELGSEGGKATLELLQWGHCRPGCTGMGGTAHEAGHRLILRVPCENMPHCHSCECGDGHNIYLTAEQETALKALLP